MKHPVSLIVLGVLMAFGATITAQEEKEAARQGREPAFQESQLISTSATVQALDQKTRLITLQGPEGNSFTFKVDDRVKNLAQVKVGDKVVVDYLESMAIQVVKRGDSDKNEKDTVVVAAEPGEKPGGIAAEKLTLTATIEKIDRTMPSITLRGPEGKLVTFMVRHPERLKLVKIGDKLQITYERAVAVSVEPAPKAAH